MVLHRELIVGAAAFASFAALRAFLDLPSLRVLRVLGVGNYNVLDSEEKIMARRLFMSGNAKVLKFWPAPGVNDAQKRALVRRAAQQLDSVASNVTAERLAAIQVRTQGSGWVATGAVLQWKTVPPHHCLTAHPVRQMCAKV